VNDSVEVLQAALVQLQAQLDEARAENRLLNEKLTAALDGTDLCVWQGEPQSGKLTVFNLQNFSSGDMAPHFDEWLAKLHPQDREATLTNYFDHLAGRTPFYEAEYRSTLPNGRVIWLWDRGRVLERDDRGLPLRIMGAHLDITRRKEYERQLSQLAYIDPLTGIANRRHLSERLQQESERSRRQHTTFALAMLDVDHFKRFNDEHGHDVGDRILTEVSRTMEEELREYDICGRWGGEEFLLILPDTSLAEALPVIRRTHQRIQQHRIEHQDQLLSITTSIGLADYKIGEHYAETLARADKALLAAKRLGRDQIQSIEFEQGELFGPEVSA
jgi:diguanylate cyclase (GGDEF)-like protein